MKEMSWTGERLVTSMESAHGTVEHLHRYAIAQKLASGKVVLDIASGEGYGSALLAQCAAKVYGVDIDESSVKHAIDKYQSKYSTNLQYLVGSASQIPLPDDSVDVVVSFETLEHHTLHEEMMLEVKRVLKKDGIFLISSPEKSIYAQRDPNNIYHVRELLFQEFKELIQRHFRSHLFFSQRFVFGSAITCLTPHVKSFEYFHGTFEAIQADLSSDKFYNQCFFNLALCSNGELGDVQLPDSLFDGVGLLKDEVKRLSSEVDLYKNSTSYRIGKFFVGLGRIFRR
ncbi:MAG: class I SAM-dependent methyltransferase [Azospira oryzae]|nr:MAG: class I SAM-dependent methyltransferase [Azospira oryzae]